MLELDTDDATYGISPITLLSALVPLLGFINANLPVLPPVLRKLFTSFAAVWSSAAPSSGSDGYGYVKKPAGNNITIGSARSRPFERLHEEHGAEIPLVSLDRHGHGRAYHGGDSSRR